MKERTLLFLYKPNEKQILLAMKKRGFGMGKWNGVGGKIEKGETIEQAAVREAHEEIGVTIRVDDLKKVAVINFHFDGKPEQELEGHVFFTEVWAGEPNETDEMRPQWYSTDALPYDSMWVDDRHWLPLVLEGKKLKARFVFSNNGSEILDQEVVVL